MGIKKQVSNERKVGDALKENYNCKEKDDGKLYCDIKGNKLRFTTTMQDLPYSKEILRNTVKTSIIEKRKFGY